MPHNFLKTMGILGKIFGKEKPVAKRKSLAPLPKPIQEDVDRTKMRIQGATQTFKPLESVQERQAAAYRLPDLSPEDPEVAEYINWAYKSAKLALEMKRPPNANYDVYMHFKKGAIIYLEPLGVYFFPTHFYRRKVGVTRPDVPGFIVDVSHLAHNLYESRMHIENSVELITDTGPNKAIVVPDSSDTVKRMPRNN